jgi:hypothetical protein
MITAAFIRTNQSFKYYQNSSFLFLCFCFFKKDVDRLHEEMYSNVSWISCWYTKKKTKKQKTMTESENVGSFFFFIIISVWASLYIPQLILRILKLTMM